MFRVDSAASIWRRRAAALALLCALAAVLAVGSVEERPAAAGAANRAGLVITFGDGTTVTHCMQFEAETISGAELLQASGLPIVMSSYGGLGGGVCRIGDEGCNDPNNCFCKCKGASCEYWAYYHLGEDGAWEYSHVGASSHRLSDGDVDGWAWGPGSTHGGATPELHSFEEICPPPEVPQPADDLELPPAASSEAEVQQSVPTAAVQQAAPPEPTPEAEGEVVQEAMAQEPTPAATGEAIREVLGEESAPQATGEAASEVLPEESAPKAAGEAESGGGRTALLAFAATAGALIVAGAGVALLRRRSHG